MTLLSPFKDLFMAIRQHIIDVAPDIYVDQDLGQLKNNKRPPVTWPCVLIDFEDFKFGNLGENVQTAAGTVVFQLGFAPHSNSTQATPQQYVQQALSYYDQELQLHRQMQGWSPGPMFGSLIRTSVVTQKRTDNYRVRELRYSIAFEDYSTKIAEQLARVALVVTDEIEL